MTRGRFISFEGGEGTGKTVQSKLLTESLRQQGIEVIITREPGGTPDCEEIRKLLVTGEPGRWEPMAELLLFMAARKQHVERLIRPALERGAWVISDRFYDSTLAYQGYGFGLDLKMMAVLRQLVLGDFTPDLTIILDISVEQGMARDGKRVTDAIRHEKMSLQFHERLRQGYLTIAKAEPQRCILVSAVPAIEIVQKAVWSGVVDRLFKGKILKAASA